MPKTQPKGTLEKLFAGPSHVRVVRGLIETEGELTQADLAKKAGVSPSGVARIIESIREDEELEDVFVSEKKYHARVYKINKGHPIAKKLKLLFSE